MEDGNNMSERKKKLKLFFMMKFELPSVVHSINGATKIQGSWVGPA